jgi:hypothetical protein
MSDPTSVPVAVGSPVPDRPPAQTDRGHQRGATPNVAGSLVEP